MRGTALGPILLLCVCGCTLSQSVRSTSRMKPATEAVLGDKVAQVDIALIECPAGDLYINKELWEQTDQQVVDLDKQMLLDENGYRVGQVVGSPPGKLQEMLSSERWCVKRRRRVVGSGYVFAQPVSPLRPFCRFRVPATEKAPLDLAAVECQFDIEPVLLDNGGTRLRFTPRLEYGQPGPMYNSSDKGWALEVKKPCQKFPAASWEVDLEPNEILVVGALLDRQESLGYQSFVDEGLTPAQRLLVIRTHRSPTSSNPGDAFGSSPPLALQASSVIRASGR